MDLQALPSPGDLFDRKYHVVRRIAEGGMGVVYEAIHQKMNLHVALKVLHPELVTDAIVTRFENEARAASLLDKAHVAQVLDVDRAENGLSYMVIELLDGVDLEAELVKRGRIPAEEAVGYILEACIPLAEAHSKGIVHRDLKPANLFLATKGDQRTLKLLDFGISKMLRERDRHLTSVPIGTPQYMSPEQVLGEEVDHRSDIWSLGVTLYELVTGRPPFSGTQEHVVSSIASGSIPPPHAFHEAIPPILEDIILRCMSRDREKRFQNVRDLALALGPFGPEDEILSISSVHRMPEPSSMKIPIAERLPLESNHALPELSSNPMEPDVGKIIAGKYQLEKLIGQGGMGEVWQARHVRLGERVAVKVLRLGSGDDETTARSRFDLEAKISAKLSRRSRHVVSVIDQGEEDGTPFLVMELLEGESLEDLLERTGVLPLPMVATVAAHVARALLVAHTEGVVHRDLKPANVFLTKDEDGKLFVKVLDFGIARVVESRVESVEIRSVRHTRRGMVVGTPAYMSPEQAKGVRNLGPECDIWALSSISYECVGGQPPFIGEMREALERLCRGEAAPISTLRNDVPPELDAVFERAFKPDKDDRFPSAQAFADALVRALGENVSGSQPEAPVSRTPKSPIPAKRSSRAWLYAGLAGILLVLGVVAVTQIKPERSTPGASTPIATVTVTVTNTVMLPPPPITSVSIPVTSLPTSTKPAIAIKPTTTVFPTPSSTAKPAASIDKGAIF